MLRDDILSLVGRFVIDELKRKVAGVGRDQDSTMAAAESSRPCRGPAVSISRRSRPQLLLVILYTIHSELLLSADIKDL